VLLAAVAALAVWQFLMLSVALIGLFLRPRPLGRALPPLVGSALVVATILLGVLLTFGVDLVSGLALGLAAFGAQVLVGYLLTFGLPARDRTHLAFAQQNGLTAIILALRLDAQYAGIVAAVAPAIVVTNVIYVACNRVLDWRNAGRDQREGRGRRPGGPGPPSGGAGNGHAGHEIPARTGAQASPRIRRSARERS
jgi:hypothetical protein